MKRYEICIDLPDTVKNIREYVEKRLKNSSVVVYFEVDLIKIEPPKVKSFKTRYK